MQSCVALTVAMLFLWATSLVHAANDSYIPMASSDGDAIVIHQGQAQVLGISPVAVPRCLCGPCGPRAPWSRPALPGALRTCRYRSPLAPQHRHRPAPLSRCHLSEATLALLPRRGDIQPCEPIGHLFDHCRQTRTADAHTGAIVHLDCKYHRMLLPTMSSQKLGFSPWKLRGFNPSRGNAFQALADFDM
jgi:hypothetical protein